MPVQALIFASALGPLPEPTAPLRALVDLDRTFWWSMAGVMALCLWTAMRWWLNRRTGTEELPLPPPPAPAQRSDFSRRIESLREEVEASRDYRKGCHALARQVREELQSTLGAGSRSLAMTAAEIAKMSPDPDIDALVRRLRQLRFAKVHPSLLEFQKLCSDAVRAFDGKSI